MQAQTRRIAIHGGAHEHVRDLGGALGDGTVLDYLPVPLQGLFASMLATRCYEVCEFSLANYLILRASGQHWLSALPVFPYRAFRHSLVVTQHNSALRDLRSLAGLRVGVPDYSMTAAVWVRGLLRADYGVDHRSITWVTTRKQRLPIPAGVRIEFCDDDLEDMLVSERIDALLGFSLRDAQLPLGERKLRTLLPDAEAAERDYFARTGIFPAHHCVVIRNDVLERHAQLPHAIASAYAQAKARAYARGAVAVLPWGGAHRNEDMQLFGGDPLPYGLSALNRMVVSTLAEDLCEQGFIERLPDLDSLFLPIPELSEPERGRSR